MLQNGGTNLKKPLLIWSSIVGFAILLFLNAFRIFFKVRPFSVNLWLKYLGRAFLLLIGIVFLPTIVLSIFADLLIQFSVIFGYIPLVYLYFSGVFATYALYKWVAQNVVPQTV